MIGIIVRRNMREHLITLEKRVEVLLVINHNRSSNEHHKRVLPD